MIEIKDLTAGYRQHPVLRSCSASIYPGQITALLGLNGIGKTTLIRTMLGFIPPVSGTITADETLIAGKSAGRSSGLFSRQSAGLSTRERASLLSYVPQKSESGFSYTCEEFVAMGAASYIGTFSSPDGETVRRAEDILSSLDCAHLIGRPLDQVSGGENRMAYLARAIMQDAKYMLMDEPVSSLDLSRQHLFLQRLRLYIDQSGHSCLLSIHDPALILPFADRFLFMHEGQIIREIVKKEHGFEQAFDEALHILYGKELVITHIEKGIHLSY